jgi:hypothetical protein
LKKKLNWLETQGMVIPLEPLRQFRQAVYQTLWPSRDAAFEIIDAIAASRDARSAVEISLSPTMERNFASVYKGIERTRIEGESLRPLLLREAERAGTLLFDGWALYALDHTPYPRPSAPTVSDRGFVHGADGVVIGHQYSLLGRVMSESGSWVGIVDCQRIASYQTPTEVGAAQIGRLKENATLDRIVSADSEYVTDSILDQADEYTRLLIRFRSNRKLFGAPKAKPTGARGAKPKHGEKIQLNREESLREADRTIRVDEADGSYTVIQVWEQMHVQSRPQTQLCAVRVEVFRADGKRRYTRPMWLAWTGPSGMDWSKFWRVYLKRFCLECVHQFTKNSLSWTRGRFGYTGREERWTWLVMLAYWQLLLAAPAARDLTRPWEKPMAEGKLPTPGRVQRDWERIFREVGSPTRSPKVRGNAIGRPKGYRPEPRTRFEVVYKGEKPGKSA